jgi:anaerobic selenocysteine-containing dehydrogenase
MTNGSGRGLDPLELEHSRLILIWGANTRLTNRHLWPTIERARRLGARLVVIDPMRTATSEALDPERGDRFIQPRPGTDIAMMLAMMHVIIADRLTDDGWIRAHTTGFDELRIAVAEWTPERAADVTGVDAAEIRALAIDYATTRPAAIRALIGAEHHENGAMFFRTLACLPALTGAWADRGGGISRSVGSFTEAVIDEAALHRCDLRPSGTPPRLLNMSRLGEILTTPHAGGDDGPGVHALVVWNCNPLVIVPNAEATRRGLEREDLFTVVHEQFLTDTARYADIVLPATTQIESTDVVHPWGHLWIGWNEAAIEPVGQSCSNTELFRRLASAMGYTEPALFDGDDALIAQALPTLDVDELRSVGWTKAPYPADGRPFGDGEFDTASGRVEFASELLEKLGHPRVPTFVPPREGPLGDADLASRYPLQLLTPKHHTRFLNSGYAQLPKHGPPEGGPFVELDPADAAARGLEEGDLARVWNDRASLALPVRISERMREGVAAIPFGWWRDHHVDGRTANSLTNDTLTEWGGGVAYSDTLVQVEALPG